MSELEIHAHEASHTADPTGRKVGILAALLAVALAITSIMSHRAHTAAILHQAAANDQWAHYQSTRVKYHNLELGENLLAVLEAKNGAAEKMALDYAAQKKKYADQGSQIQANAQRAENEAAADERRALHYDIGEGFFEISVVLTSLYFISRKILFPIMAVVAGAAGALAAFSTIIVS
jgi:hypothetical protein